MAFKWFSVELTANLVTYNTYISLCRWFDAIATMAELKQQNLKPTAVTYGALITVPASSKVSFSVSLRLAVGRCSPGGP